MVQSSSPIPATADLDRALGVHRNLLVVVVAAS